MIRKHKSKERISTTKRKIKLSRKEGEVIEKFYDFFEHFRLEDEIIENLQNMRLNRPEYRWIFINADGSISLNGVEDEFFGAITTRIYNKSHIIIFIFGPTNSGKSEVAQAIARKYQKIFYKVHKIYIEIMICFSEAEFSIAIKDLPIGHLVLADEVSKTSGKGSANLNKNTLNLLRIVRAHQNSFIFINPDLIETKMIDYYIEVLGKNYRTRKVRVILYKNMFDPITNQKFLQPIGKMYLKLHDDEEFREEYRQRKNLNIINMKHKRGAIETPIDINKLKKDANILAKICYRANIWKKIGMQIRLLNYNAKFDYNNEEDKEKIIGGDTYFNELLFEQTLQNMGVLKKNSKKEAKEKIIEEQNEFLKQLTLFEFPYTEKEIEKRAFDKCKFWDKERDFEIYHTIKDDKAGDIKYEHLVKKYDKISDTSSISKIYEKVKGIINRIKGELLERSYVQFLSQIYEDKVIRDGSKSKPDAYVLIEKKNELHVFSIKNLKLKKDKGDTYYLPMKEILPELKYAFDNLLNYNLVRLFNIALNNLDNTIHVNEIKNFSRTKSLEIKIK